MRITPIIRRPLEVTRVDESVKAVLRETTPESPAFFVKTPQGFANLSLGAEAYQSEELGELMKPLGKLTSTVVKDLFPQSEGVLDGIGYAIGIAGGVSDFENEANFENGLKVLTPVVKILSRSGKGFLPGWANQMVSALDGGLTLIAAFRKAGSQKEPTFKTALMDGLNGTPVRKYVGPIWTLGEFFARELDSQARILGGPAITMEDLQKALEEKPEHPWVASLRKQAEASEQT